MLFELRLALALGRTLAELRGSIGADEYPLWAAFAQIDGPFWGERQDILAARICQVWGGGKLDDYIPKWSGPDEVSPQMLASMMRAAAAGEQQRKGA